MRIAGRWLFGADGVSRPIVAAAVRAADGHPHFEHFLVDTGADRTALSAAFLARLRLPTNPPPSGLVLAGIGGTSPFVVVQSVIEFACDDGGAVRVHGRFGAFVDPSATDLSILGRDVLDNFDVLVSRRRNEVLLLAPNHHYHITRA